MTDIYANVFKNKSNKKDRQKNVSNLCIGMRLSDDRLYNYVDYLMYHSSNGQRAECTKYFSNKYSIVHSSMVDNLIKSYDNLSKMMKNLKINDEKRRTLSYINEKTKKLSGGNKILDYGTYKYYMGNIGDIIHRENFVLFDAASVTDTSPININNIRINLSALQLTKYNSRYYESSGYLYKITSDINRDNVEKLVELYGTVFSISRENIMNLGVNKLCNLNEKILDIYINNLKKQYPHDSVNIDEYFKIINTTEHLLDEQANISLRSVLMTCVCEIKKSILNLTYDFDGHDIKSIFAGDGIKIKNLNSKILDINKNIKDNYKTKIDLNKSISNFGILNYYFNSINYYVHNIIKCIENYILAYYSLYDKSIYKHSHSPNVMNINRDNINDLINESYYANYYVYLVNLYLEECINKCTNEPRNMDSHINHVLNKLVKMIISSKRCNIYFINLLIINKINDYINKLIDIINNYNSQSNPKKKRQRKKGKKPTQQQTMQGGMILNGIEIKDNTITNINNVINMILEYYMDGLEFHVKISEELKIYNIEHHKNLQIKTKNAKNNNQRTVTQYSRRGSINSLNPSNNNSNTLPNMRYINTNTETKKIGNVLNTTKNVLYLNNFNKTSKNIRNNNMRERSQPKTFTKQYSRQLSSKNHNIVV